VSKAFPSGEGGSRVSRKRETDEGFLRTVFSLIRPLRRAPLHYRAIATGNC